jgi:hypothetical protein
MAGTLPFGRPRPQETAMSDRHPDPASPREQLRQRWLRHAAAAFDRMFADDQQDHLVTFDQREERAIDLGQDLAAWLLEQHTAADPDARPTQPPACPKWGRPTPSYPSGS